MEYCAKPLMTVWGELYALPSSKINSLLDIHEYGLSATGIVFNPYDLFFTTPKGRNQELRVLLDGYLDRWRQNGDSIFARAEQRWMYGSVATVSVIPGWIVTNMMKHAFAGREGGLISVSACVDGGRVKVMLEFDP